jgi:hypothetical protein
MIFKPVTGTKPFNFYNAIRPKKGSRVTGTSTTHRNSRYRYIAGLSIQIDSIRIRIQAKTELSEAIFKKSNFIIF